MAIKVKKTEEQRNVPALSMRATFSPGSLNAEKRTVEMVWTTGARVMRGYYERFWEELSLDPKHVRMDRLNNGAPLLMDHDGSRVASTLGVVESAKLEAKRGTAVVRFAAEGINPEADRVFNLVKDGIVQNISVGYRVHKLEKTEEATDKIPVYRATDWEPHELSVVAMGADDGAGFRNFNSETNPCIFSRSTESNAMTPEEIAAAEAKATEQRNADLKAAAEAAAKGERERASKITLSVRAAGLGEDLAAKLIADGSTIDAAREIVLNTLAERSAALPPAPNAQHLGASVQVTETENEKFIRGVSAWLHEKAGNGLVELAKERKVKGFEKVETDGAEFRGMSIADIARACLERRGVSLRGVYGAKALIQRALDYRSGYAATGDFAVLFENVMHKQMLAAYAVQAHVWKRFCRSESVSDFRAHNRFRGGSFSTLDVVAENGEFKNKAIPDGAKISISLQTYGNIIAISRQALMNDDMGALANLSVEFGKAAGNSIESAVFAMLGLNSGLGPTMSDSAAYFHANRANVSTGAALSAAALAADRSHMRRQLDISGNRSLDINPSILLISPELEVAAKILNTDAFDPAQTGQKSNSARGMFQDIVSSPYLAAASTRRYLFAPSKDAFVVVFGPDGEGPVMESQDGFRVDGLEWKARLDFKVNAFDPKMAITNAGT